MITKTKRRKLIEKNRKHEKDTGSSDVQVAILNQRIAELTEHLKTHRKDNHSRRGLLTMVSKRRAHEKYIAKRNKKV